MNCLVYDPNKSDKAKKTVDLILETIWMANCSRELLASVYGVHPITLAKWLSSEFSAEKYRDIIFEHHQFMLDRLYQRICARKN